MPRRYPPEIRRQVVELARSGTKVAQLVATFGMSEATIYHCVRFLERFMSFRFGETLGELYDITPDDIVAFLARLTAGLRPYRDKTPPTHLRTLFKFLFWSGKTRRNLANSVPRVAQPRPANLPRHLMPDEIQQLIDAVPNGTELAIEYCQPQFTCLVASIRNPSTP